MKTEKLVEVTRDDEKFVAYSGALGDRVLAVLESQAKHANNAGYGELPLEITALQEEIDAILESRFGS